MGYLRFFAAIAGLTDASSLHRLPKSMPWRAYLTQDGLVLIEWLRRPNPNNVPRSPVVFPKMPTFSCRPSGVTFRTGFGAGAPGLDDLYAALGKQKKAGTLPAVAVHSALLLHDLTRCPVLSIASDDEEWDLACEVRDGGLHHVTFASGDEDISVDRHGKIVVADAPGAQHLLHRIASRESAPWSEALLGLFGFDGGVEHLKLTEIGRATETPVSSPPDAPKPKRPFWKFWLRD